MVSAEGLARLGLDGSLGTPPRPSTTPWSTVLFACLHLGKWWTHTFLLCLSESRLVTVQTQTTLKKWCFASKLCLRPVCISWCRQSQLALFTLQACQSWASSSSQQRDFVFQSGTWIICSTEMLKMLYFRSFFSFGLVSKQLGEEKQHFSSCISPCSNVMWSPRRQLNAS